MSDAAPSLPGVGRARSHNLRDPEGLLSDLPAFGTALLGLLTGLWLRGQRAVKAKTLGLAVAAVACLALGYLWSLEFPLNKNLWTSSFVLVAAGWSLSVLTLAYWVVEQWDGARAAARELFFPGWSSARTPSWLICSANCWPARWALLPSQWADGRRRCSSTCFPHLRAYPRSGLGGVCLLGFVHRGVLSPGVVPLSQADFCEGIGGVGGCGEGLARVVRIIRRSLVLKSFDQGSRVRTRPRD